MSVARLVSRLSQPLLTSLSPRLAGVQGRPPCRDIATSSHQVKCGKRGEKTSQPDISRQLDIFLGNWVETQGSPEKSYINFLRNNGGWKVQLGEVDSSSRESYSFTLGKPFFLEQPDKVQLTVVVYQDNRRMRWHIQSMESPPAITHVVTEVNGPQLVWETIYPDKSVTTKYYKRS